jgi:hypothetical protein
LQILDTCQPNVVVNDFFLLFDFILASTSFVTIITASVLHVRI